MSMLRRLDLSLSWQFQYGTVTKIQSAQMERIQKAAFHIILDKIYDSYQLVCSVLVMQTIESRRNKLCAKFVKKEVKKTRSIFTN